MSESMTHLLEHANSGYIGINDKLEVSSGYDQEEGLAAATGRPDHEWFYDEEMDGKMLTREDRLRLAVMMIERWTRYLHVALEHGTWEQPQEGEQND